ncbi:hypothetical protein AMJ80_08670 [bacterium SM23_31]|nr:MAG: hypothetical protein AMJ80_08670 [bacterium SM23_31]
MAIRIIIVDSSELIRAGLRNWIESKDNFEVIAEAENAKKAVELANKLKPDIVIVGVKLPELNGIEITKKILNQNPETKIIAILPSAEKSPVSTLLYSGVKGFLYDFSQKELIDAVNRVKKENIYFSINAASIFYEGDEEDKNYQLQTGIASISSLTHMELEVLKLIAAGKTSQTIADTLFVSINTVNKHRQNIMNKLNLHKAAELTKFAIYEGII